MKKDMESSESAEHDPDHGGENPAGSTGFGGLVVAHQSAMLHQPAEGAFDHPAFGQHFESAHVVAAFDDFDFQFGALGFDPRGEVRSGVAAIHPEFAQPGEVRQ